MKTLNIVIHPAIFRSPLDAIQSRSERFSSTGALWPTILEAAEVIAASPDLPPFEAAQGILFC